MPLCLELFRLTSRPDSFVWISIASRVNKKHLSLNIFGVGKLLLLYLASSENSAKVASTESFRCIVLFNPLFTHKLRPVEIQPSIQHSHQSNALILQESQTSPPTVDHQVKTAAKLTTNSCYNTKSAGATSSNIPLSSLPRASLSWVDFPCVPRPFNPLDCWTRDLFDLIRAVAVNFYQPSLSSLLPFPRLSPFERSNNCPFFSCVGHLTSFSSSSHFLPKTFFSLPSSSFNK
ncbi:hypothetical protein GE09DRAFT_92252 [Coniochaeta sp. 2T2.1]|nr:hypothetical protein GE09DRAFT_92252 [Coniochaeta sp. 2T2.1]